MPFALMCFRGELILQGLRDSDDTVKRARVECVQGLRITLHDTNKFVKAPPEPSLVDYTLRRCDNLVELWSDSLRIEKRVVEGLAEPACEVLRKQFSRTP